VVDAAAPVAPVTPCVPPEAVTVEEVRVSVDPVNARIP
jgi:hypothetical protein